MLSAMNRDVAEQAAGAAVSHEVFTLYLYLLPQGRIDAFHCQATMIEARRRHD